MQFKVQVFQESCLNSSVPNCLAQSTSQNNESASSDNKLQYLLLFRSAQTGLIWEKSVTTIEGTPLKTAIVVAGSWYPFPWKMSIPWMSICPSLGGEAVHHKSLKPQFLESFD